jgi:hypothetical protein
MIAPPERDMAIGVTQKIDIRVWKLGFIIIGRPDRQHDGIAGLQLDPADLNVLLTERGMAITGVSHLRSSSTAAGMIDGSLTIWWRCWGWVARKATMQSRVAVTVATEQQQVADAEELGLAQGFAIDRRVDDAGQQTVRGFQSAAGNEVAKVLADLVGHLGTDVLGAFEIARFY